MNKAMRTLWAAGAIASALSAARAVDVSGTPGAFAPIAVGGRGTALAGAQTAAPAGVEAILYNPAAMAETRDWSGGYYYSNMYDLVPFHFTSGTYRLKGRPYVLGAAWLQNGDDVYSENEVLLGGAFERGWVHLGAAYKLRFAGTGGGGSEFIDQETGLGHQVQGTALGLLGFDLGAAVRPFGPKYAMGVTLKDLFSRISWDTRNEAGTAMGEYAEYVPVTLRYGFLFDPDPFLDLVVDYEPSLYHDGFSKLATGVEVVPFELLPDSRIKPYVHDLLAARIGYARNMFTKEASHRLSTGAGLGYRYLGMRLNVDMAYEWVYNFEHHDNVRLGFNLSR
ncbi:MAG TPA: hypothetical protein VJ385_18965 [Fibrobacteria bacterium]|nr:hypothetical protein [Fibrobacteria bacterium]